MKETAQRMNRLKEALERQKRREPGTFERYNYEILDYLRYKFPEESESAVREDLDVGGTIVHSFGGGGHQKAAGSTFDGWDVRDLIIREALG